jgi:hypothetical protein
MRLVLYNCTISYPLVGQKEELTVDMNRYTSLYSVHGPDFSLKLSNTFQIQTLSELPEVSLQNRWRQITVMTVGTNCMKCYDVLIVGSGHGRRLGQWLQSNLGNEYSVTSVLSLSVELCNVVRKFVVLSKKGTPNNNGVGVQIS